MIMYLADGGKVFLGFIGGSREICGKTGKDKMDERKR